MVSAKTIEPVTVSPATVPGFHEVTWPAYAGSTYYLQTSPDLIDWTVNPSCVIGNDMLHGMVFGGPTPLFARMMSYQGLPFDDNDGDGLSNHHETTSSFTDPNAADSDGDGASDGEESAAHTDPNDPASGPAFVVEIALPPDAHELQIFLDENLAYLGDNSGLVPAVPGTVSLSDPQESGSWQVELFDPGNPRTALVDFRRFQALPESIRLTLLNTREVWIDDEIEVDVLDLEIPVNGLQAQTASATNDPLPTNGGYGDWKLLPQINEEKNYCFGFFHRSRVLPF